VESDETLMMRQKIRMTYEEAENFLEWELITALPGWKGFGLKTLKLMRF
jgi:hypothetical protein